MKFWRLLYSSEELWPQKNEKWEEWTNLYDGQVHVRTGTPYKAMKHCVYSFSPNSLYVVCKTRQGYGEIGSWKLVSLLWLFCWKFTSKRIKANWIHVGISNVPTNNLCDYQAMTLHFYLRNTSWLRPGESSDRYRELPLNRVFWVRAEKSVKLFRWEVNFSC
jgi:hypothetical protein